MRTDHEGVLDAAVRLLAVNPGASTVDIAKAAGISRATLHRLYPSRDVLIEDLAERALVATQAAIDAVGLERAQPIDGFQRLVDALLPLAHQYAFLMNEAQLDHSPRIVDATRRFDTRLEEFFTRGQMEGAFRVDLPASWMGLLLMHTLVAASEGLRLGIMGHREAPRLVSLSLLSGVRSETS